MAEQPTAARPGERRDDPVLRHSKREALVICAAWAAATATCCIVSYVLGYRSDERPLGPEDVRPIWGIPFWFFWGVLAPWAACIVFTWWFAGFYMKEDDLGRDHAAELESDIREGGENA